MNVLKNRLHLGIWTIFCVTMKLLSAPGRMIIPNQSLLRLPPTGTEGKHSESSRATQRIRAATSGFMPLGESLGEFFHSPPHPPPHPILNLGNYSGWALVKKKSIFQTKTLGYLRSICKYIFFLSICKCQCQITFSRTVELCVHEGKCIQHIRGSSTTTTEALPAQSLPQLWDLRVRLR